MIAARPPPARHRDRPLTLLVLTPPEAVETLVAIVQEHVLPPTTPFGA